VIHPELKNLLPPLTEKEYAGLEKDILERGCLSSIVAWNDIIVDGHNRYEICQDHGLPFDIRQLEFASLDDAKFWAWTHQENQRNLTSFQKAELALKFKPQIEKQARERQRGGQGGVLLCQVSDKAIDTKKELAAIAGISHDTIHKAEFLDKHADEETKEKLRQGKTTINREYKQAKEKAAKPKTTRTQKASEESPTTEPQQEPESSEPSPSKPKNVPCIEELVSVKRTTLKDIRQDDPDHLLRNLATHFRKGYIEDLILKGMDFLLEYEGEKVTTSLLKELNQRFKTKH
jgi:hypothetical protein